MDTVFCLTMFHENIATGKYKQCALLVETMRATNNQKTRVIIYT